MKQIVWNLLSPPVVIFLLAISLSMYLAIHFSVLLCVYTSKCEAVSIIRLEANTCEIDQQKSYMLPFNAYAHYKYASQVCCFILFQLPGANNFRRSIQCILILLFWCNTHTKYDFACITRFFINFFLCISHATLSVRRK